LKRVPSRPERGVYLTAIVVLTISLLAVMGTSYHQRNKLRRLRQERAALADDLVHLRTQNEMQRQTYCKDQVYIGWLEESLSHYEGDGTPDAWRDFAVRRAAVIQSETSDERATREAREGRYTLGGRE
jgi:hypothetical protein